jgi:hypothetical protein
MGWVATGKSAIIGTLKLMSVCDFVVGLDCKRAVGLNDPAPG